MTELSHQQIQAAQLLATGTSVKETAKLVDKGRTTIHHWKNSPLFRAEMNRVRQELAFQLVDKLQSSANLALDKLSELIESDDPAIALKSAQFCLNKVVQDVTYPNLGATTAEGIVEEDTAAEQRELLSKALRSSLFS